jgi:hypothetical protein
MTMVANRRHQMATVTPTTRASAPPKRSWEHGPRTSVIVFLSLTGGGAAGGDCRGGSNKSDPMNTTYRSADGVHWTAIYPCLGGSTTAIPVPAADVPGGGG